MSVKIHIGDCRKVLKGMRAQSVHMCVTSPPYWGLRDYDTPPQIWGGGEDCDHVWGDELPSKKMNPQQDASGGVGGGRLHGTRGNQGWTGGASGELKQGQFCQNCNAWRGNLGLEPTPQMFVDHLVEVFREVWRVLRDDGLLFINLGDSYQDKQLLGIPWMVAFALQANGWIRRNAVPWVKANPLPESVRDRVTTAHEYVFMLAKSRRYFYDGEAVKEDGSKTSHGGGRKHAKRRSFVSGRNDGGDVGGCAKTALETGGRNRRTSDTFRESLDIRIADQRAYLAHLEHVRDNGGMMLSEPGEPVALLVNTASFKGAHFATFPTKLVHPLIAAGTSQRGACPDCGAPWVRVVEKGFTDHTGKTKTAYPDGMNANNLARLRQAARENGREYVNQTATTGWQPTCPHYDDRYRAEFPQARNPRKRHQRHVSGDWFRRVRKRPGRDNWETKPCVVLDAFGGSGTSALEADRMGRDAVIIELNAKYAEMARDRIAGDVPMFADVEVIDDPTGIMPDVEILTKSVS